MHQLSGAVDDGKQYDEQDAQLVLDKGTPRYITFYIYVPLHELACVAGYAVFLVTHNICCMCMTPCRPSSSRIPACEISLILGKAVR